MNAFLGYNLSQIVINITVVFSGLETIRIQTTKCQYRNKNQIAFLRLAERPIENGVSVVIGIFGNRENVIKSIAIGCKASKNIFATDFIFSFLFFDCYGF